jgi:hypothetical protein
VEIVSKSKGVIQKTRARGVTGDVDSSMVDVADDAAGDGCSMEEETADEDVQVGTPV